jgi:transposase
MPPMRPVSAVPKYPLLEELLSSRGLALKGLYTNNDVAQLFGVSVRSIQEWIAKGRLSARDLPGWGRFISQDLEEFLASSTRKKPE